MDGTQEMTDLLDLGALLNQQVRALSLGERMEYELATSLLHQPAILFLDEPTIGGEVIMQSDTRCSGVTQPESTFRPRF